MKEDFPIKDIDQNIINKRFESTHFHCIRCGSIDIEKSEIAYYANGHHNSNAFPSDTKDAFIVTGMLYCKKCKHNFSVRITDMKRE